MYLVPDTFTYTSSVAFRYVLAQVRIRASYEYIVISYVPYVDILSSFIHQLNIRSLCRRRNQILSIDGDMDRDENYHQK